jgi:hypothetical protein
VFKPTLDMEPLLQHVDEMLLSAIQTMFDRLMPPGSKCYWKADFFKVTQEGAQLLWLLKQYTHFLKCTCTLLAETAGRVPKDATMGVIGILNMPGYCWCDPVLKMPIKLLKWRREYWDALHPFSGGVYLNFIMDEGQHE